MIQNAWQNADTNIQYRILNALIKESIWPEQTIITTQNHQLTIQYHGCILSTHFNRKSMMSRYDFKGPITYQCGNENKTITEVEKLLSILKHHFDIDIQQQLINEIIHSRDSFVEIYKQFDQRQHNVQSSMQFSCMPTTLNFFAWLQHLSDSNEINDLLYSESLVLEGHPTHPLTKTKLPLTMDEVKMYSPEFEKVIPLKIMLLQKDCAQATSIDGTEDFILREVIPEYQLRLRKYAQSIQISLEDYYVILVHPWQYNHTIYDKFSNWIAHKLLVTTPFEVDSKATLSFRTMSLINKPYHVKLPVNVQATSAVRTVSSVTTVDGPKLSKSLHNVLNQYSQLNVAIEPYGLCAKTNDDDARQLACIIREKPYIANNGVTIVTGALVNPNPIDQHITVDSYIEWVNGEVNKSGIITFMENYSRQLITPLLNLIQDYGIALEAHMQNTIVNLGPNFQMNFIVRDLGGSRIDLNTLTHKMNNIQITNQSLLAQTIEEVIAKFQHAVIQNQLAELIYHFSKKEIITEAELFHIVRKEVGVAINEHKPHAQALRDVLFGPTITVKALLRMRMTNRVKKYLNIQLENPIRKEV
ncbi:IucA/IucC family protein [Staphylococcus borealis]|uniref:IucA/IucC family protein n=1 Tax=Staphylococcus borealis TaxID=2742203 RepID=UPI002DBCEB46|nr:IucA/IucC family protein [Staphylococcus borealis]MEB7365992.1 siderophore synthetase [Staphylococcus borealis]MEB7458606.1 siderophore synthetase [Staphylococcus borealis]